MVSVARKNLFHDLPRFLVAQAGIVFAVSLVTIQTGLFNGFTRSSSILIDKGSNADIWVASEDVRHLDLSLPIPYQRLTQARQVAGVETAEALIIQGSVWRRGSTNQIAPMTLVGFDPNGQLFRPWNIKQGSLNQLKQPYRVMVDKTDLASLGIQRVNQAGEIGSFPARVAGLTEGVRSIVSSSFVFTSLENAEAYINSPIAAPSDNPPDPAALTSKDQIFFVLVRAEPGQDLQGLKQRLETALPKTRAYTQAEISEMNQTYWQQSTGVGFILGLGAVVGVIVGVVIVGQILYAVVSDHLKEFGTLKAMGASNWFLYRLILEQALWMAVLGFIPGIGLCMGLGAWTLETKAITILISPSIAAGTFGLTVIMCIGAAVFAIQKATRLDPAMVFKA